MACGLGGTADSSHQTNAAAVVDSAAVCATAGNIVGKGAFTACQHDGTANGLHRAAVTIKLENQDRGSDACVSVSHNGLRLLEPCMV